MNPRELIVWTLAVVFCFVLIVGTGVLTMITVLAVRREFRRFQEESRSWRIAVSIRPVFDPPEYQECIMPPVQESSTQFTVTQQRKCRPKFLDRRGNETPIDGTPTFVSSDEQVVVVEQVEGGWMFKGRSTGTADVTISADARIGSEVVTITETIHVTILPDEAIDIDAVFDEPEDQPTP